MRGKKAKALRRKVYGDLSHASREYREFRTGQVVADNLRHEYQRLKGRRRTKR